jgi:hypothetical protein
MSAMTQTILRGFSWFPRIHPGKFRRPRPFPSSCIQFSSHDRAIIWRHIVWVIALSVYGCTALVDLGRIFSFLISYTVGRTPWTGNQPVSRPLPTHRTTQTDIHVSSGIRTHDPSVWAGEDGSCLRLHGHCDRPLLHYYINEWVLRYLSLLTCLPVFIQM